MTNSSASADTRHRGYWKLFAVIAICAAPLIASYFTYYVIKPQSRTNYGNLLDPKRYPIPALGSKSLDGQPPELTQYQGKWIFLTIDHAECQLDCRKKLTDMRQIRLTQGKERDRIERVWLIADDAPLDTVLIREFDGTHMLRAPATQLQRWLPTEHGTTVYDHLYLIDPLGNLMMRFPKQADPGKIKKDIGKLLKASRIG